MRNSRVAEADVCSQSVLTASTVSTLRNSLRPTGDPSLVFDSLRTQPQRTASDRYDRPLNLTERDMAIVDLVLRLRALTADQLQVAFFSDGAASRCQRRLTLLRRAGYLDVLAGRLVNQPAVYLLSRKSIAGNRLMRATWGEACFRRFMTNLGPIAHLLAINDLRVRLERACNELGWTLAIWERAEELANRFSSSRLIPDGYFRLQRGVEGQVRSSGFFIELERAEKSSRVVAAKLANYAKLYYSGEYERLYGTRALRILFVFAPTDPSAAKRKVIATAAEAERLRITIVRCAAMRDITSIPPSGLLTAPVWWRPGQLEPSPLF